jgi:nicotinate-nucleotide adenylyltransferase
VTASASVSNIGIFGGTFDPPHVGHLIAAQDACEALSLGRFIFVPAAE